MITELEDSAPFIPTPTNEHDPEPLKSNQHPHNLFP